METKFTVTRRYHLFSYIKKFVTKRIYKSVIRKSNCSYLDIVGFSSFQFPYNFSLLFHLLQQLFIDFVSHNAWFGLSPSNSNSKRFTQHGITAPSSRLHPTIVLRFTTVCSFDRLYNSIRLACLTRVFVKGWTNFLHHIHIQSVFQIDTKWWTILIHLSLILERIDYPTLLITDVFLFYDLSESKNVSTKLIWNSFQNVMTNFQYLDEFWNR